MIASIETIKHELVPKHEIMSAKEKDEFLKEYGATLGQLPKILASDPIAEMLGAKAKDIIRITRESETAGIAVYYRVVVEK